MEIKFKDEKLPYKVRARSDRYMVCTREIDLDEDADLLGKYPKDKLKEMCIYTIVDKQADKRSTTNRIFEFTDFTKDKECGKLMLELIRGEVELSRRNAVDLFVEYIKD